MAPKKRISSRLLSKGHFSEELSFVQAGFATPDGGSVDCPICREVFGDEEVGGMAAMDGPARYALMDCCEHPFHVGCLEHWSTQRENSCPSCRATIHYVAEYSLSRPEDSSRADWRLMIEQVIQVQEAKQADTLDEEEDGFPSSEESDAPTYRCVICGDSIIQAAPADQRGVMLLCDAELPRKRTRKGPSKVMTCDAPFHPFCAGYPNVPDGEVFCPQHSNHLPPPVVEESISSTVSSPAVSSSSAEPSESLPCESLPSDVKSKEIVELGTSSEEDEEEEEVKDTPKEKSRKKKPMVVLPTYITVTAPQNWEVAITVGVSNSVVDGHAGDESGLVREVKKGVVEAMLNWREVLVEKGVVWEAERFPTRGYFQLDFADNTVATGKMICKILRSLKSAQVSYDKKTKKLGGANQTKITWFLSDLDVSGTNLNPMEVGEVSSLLSKLSSDLWPSVHSVPLHFKALRLARLSAGGKMAAAAKLKTAGVDVEIGRGEVPEEDFLLGAVPKERRARTLGRRRRRAGRPRQAVQWRPMKGGSDSEDDGVKDTLMQAARFELRSTREDTQVKDTPPPPTAGRFSLSQLLGAQTVYQKNIRQPLRGLSYLGAPPPTEQRHAPQTYPMQRRPPQNYLANDHHRPFEQPRKASSPPSSTTVDRTVSNFVATICKERRLISWPSSHFDGEVEKISKMMVEKYSCLLNHDGGWRNLIDHRRGRLAEWIEEKVAARKAARSCEKVGYNSGAKFRKIGLG
ncbi:hypothetical protein FOL46_008465 [Perkinsus olseni]|uniref:RING-type domain-containing protein n=1 Tax=Perkinsus olseni TaxID=32597 RepID=A0A7J6MMG3_PEROL|nr:hypothetical protein FOL46_008465 [Perkinsus olseni]